MRVAAHLALLFTVVLVPQRLKTMKTCVSGLLTAMLSFTLQDGKVKVISPFFVKYMTPHVFIHS